MFSESLYFGVAISLTGYAVGLFLKKKLKWGILNPLLLSIVFVIAALQILDVEYETYNETAQYLSYLLTPATVALAIPLYQKIDLLKKNLLAVSLGASGLPRQNRPGAKRGSVQGDTRGGVSAKRQSVERSD